MSKELSFLSRFCNRLAHRLIQRVDPEMYSLVNQAASMPFFALSWALTLFSHDLYEVSVIARLFDFLLAHNPAMISYLVVAVSSLSTLSSSSSFRLLERAFPVRDLWILTERNRLRSRFSSRRKTTSLHVSAEMTMIPPSHTLSSLISRI